MNRDENLQRQTFLQIFMSRGILNLQEIKKLLVDLEVPTDSADGISKFVSTANESIAPFNLEIKKGFEEDDGQPFYCLVNTVETPISRLSSTYTPSELELFKKLIEHIVDSEEGKVGSLAAVLLADKIEKKMGKEEAEDILEKLERDKWIRKDEEGKISLSVRSLLELDQYLKDVFADFIKLCNICSKICLMGETCANCGIKLHFKCAKALFAKQGKKTTCPAPDCRVVWGQIR